MGSCLSCCRARRSKAYGATGELSMCSAASPVDDSPHNKVSNVAGGNNHAPGHPRNGVVPSSSSTNSSVLMGVHQTQRAALINSSGYRGTGGNSNPAGAYYCGATPVGGPAGMSIVQPSINGPLLHSISQGNLQHISEREPDDIELDPSLNPTRRTLFLSRSIHEVEQTIRKRRSMYDKNSSRRYLQVTRRYSSCSSIILDDSTVSRPNGKSTVRALSLAIYYQIRNRDRTHSDEYHQKISPPIFDERLHPLCKDPVPKNYASQDVDFRLVYRFVRTLFQMAQLSPECAVVTMVYMERLLTSAEIELYPGNWKRVLLCCILLASKVWDDQAVWNVDYCQILRDIKVDDVNELERQFLEIIQFNINVPASVYAKYYFDIRALSDSAHHMPLSRDRAFKLEAISRILDDPFREILQGTSGEGAARKWGSLDTMTQSPRFQPAILP